MGEVITIAEIKTLIKEEKVKPSDLFSMEALTEDPSVKGFVDASCKEAVGGEYKHRKRIDTKFDAEKEDWEKEKEEKEKEIKKLKSDGAKRDAVDLFAKKTKERKLDEKQTKFIESKQADFVPEDPEKLDKEVDQFMDSKIEEFKKTAEIFGHKVETEEEKKGGGGPGKEEEGDASFIPD